MAQILLKRSIMKWDSMMYSIQYDILSTEHNVRMDKTFS